MIVHVELSFLVRGWRKILWNWEVKKQFFRFGFFGDKIVDA